MSLSVTPFAQQSITVATTELVVMGASSWTGADPNSGADRQYEITNNGSTDVFVGTIATFATTQYVRKIAAGETQIVLVRAGTSLYINRTSGTGYVSARGVGF